MECPFNTFTINIPSPLMGEGQGGGKNRYVAPLPLIPYHQGRGDIFGKVIYESKH